MKDGMYRVFRQKLRLSGKLSRPKYLIIHADDMGLTQSTNTACIEAMEKGMVNSGSIIIPSAFADHIINYSKNHPEKDIGIHLTLTCEWTEHQWQPVLKNEVPSLVDSYGNFYQTTEELAANANLAEVEAEMRAQIELALKKGLKPTHLDCHMFSSVANPKFLKIYIALGKEYKLPVLLNSKKIKKWFRYDIKQFISEDEILVDKLFIATPHRIRNGIQNFYRNVLKTLKPGINCILIHPAYEQKDIKQLTRGYTAYNSSWRQSDFNFFTSDECRTIIKKNNIHQITWRELTSIR